MTAEPVAETNIAAKTPVQRLCNEIQLFDLCDLERCSFKKERFCTNVDLLTAFERISDAEVSRPAVYEESEEGEDAGDEEYDDDFEDDGYGEKAEYDEEF